jgi:hypothetical protein
MANHEHIGILKRGVQEWNKWRQTQPKVQPDLSHLDFGEEFEILFDFKGLNMSGAYLESSVLFSLNFENANFAGASFQNCNCCATSFKNANLSSTDLQLANLTLTILDGANFDGAYLGNTVFGSCDLSTAKNLENCEHLHSSIIDHLTLIESNYIPLGFLQGCGLPDFIIDNVLVLRSNPIMFNSCFISYSSKDEKFAKRLYSDLQSVGIRCWFAPEDLQGGKKTYDQINTAIRIHEKLLLLISPNSMKSVWVATEIKRARSRERAENRQMFFPISLVPYSDIRRWELFDADSGADLAEELRSYHILDFSNWNKDENYQLTLGKLIESLKK